MSPVPCRSFFAEDMQELKRIHQVPVVTIIKLRRKILDTASGNQAPELGRLGVRPVAKHVTGRPPADNGLEDEGHGAPEIIRYSVRGVKKTLLSEKGQSNRGIIGRCRTTSRGGWRSSPALRVGSGGRRRSASTSAAPPWRSTSGIASAPSRWPGRLV